MTKKDLEEIKSVVEVAIKAETEPLSQQLGTLESGQQRLEANQQTMQNRTNLIQRELLATEERLSKKIEDTQAETIEQLTGVISDAYDAHRERIIRIEKHLDLPTLH